MGLPETFVSFESEPQRYVDRLVLQTRKTALIILNENVASANASKYTTSSLGFQYVFAIFPVTYLFYEHSSDSFLQEMLAKSLLDNGFQVFTATPHSAVFAAQLLNPDLILSGEFSEFSLNAYDYFFLRKLSLKGGIVLRRHVVSLERKLEINKTINVPLSASRFHPSGKAPILAIFAEEQLSLAINSGLRLQGRLLRKPTRLFPSAISGVSPTILVEPPTSAYPLSEEIRQALTDSYGFPGYPSYNSGAVLRIVQKGIEYGVSLTDYSLMVALGNNSVNVSQLQPIFHLNTRVEELKLEYTRDVDIPRLQISIALVLNSDGKKLANRKISPIREITCNIKIKPIDSADAKLIRTLEYAAFVATRFFLQGTTPGKEVSEFSCY